MARRRLPGNCFEEGTSSLLAVRRSIGDCGGAGGDDQNRKLCDLGRLGGAGPTSVTGGDWMPSQPLPWAVCH